MTPEEKPSSAEGAAKKYAEGCDNESGGFLSRDLEKIRKKGFLAGAEWKAAQVAEAVGKLEDARWTLTKRCPCCDEGDEFAACECDIHYQEKAVVMLDAAIALLKEGKK